MATLVSHHHIDTDRVLRAGLSLPHGDSGVVLLRNAGGENCVGNTIVLRAAALLDDTYDFVGALLTQWHLQGATGVVLECNGPYFLIRVF